MLNIDEIVREHKLFVDTCSFMHKKATSVFAQFLIPALERTETQLIVAHKVLQELERLQSRKEPETQLAARQAARLVQDLKDKKLIVVRGEDGDPFADNVFHYIFSKFRTKYDLALITQDVALAKDIDRLRESTSVKSSRSLKLLKITWKGNLVEWCLDPNGKPPGRPAKPVKPLFDISEEPVSTRPKQLRVSSIPGTGDSVKTKTEKTIRIGQEIAAGGEGRIFQTSQPGVVCKLYFKEKLTSHRQAKLELMVSNNISWNGICWPLDLLYNRNSEFVGYLMPEAKGVPLQHSIFLKPRFLSMFPDWNRIHLVDLAITLVETVQFLHQQNVLIGDINPMNVLVSSPKQVYLVDTDSFQVGQFPCPVGMVNYTAPEIQGKAFDTFLRTKEHEYFALATLLFMILLPGKSPYSHQGGGDPSANIKSMSFPYPLGDAKTGQTPQGPWRFIWSNLSFKLKEAFWQAFAENQRLSPEHWLDLLRRYRNDLQQGYVSDDLFPTTFKKVSEHAQREYGTEDSFETMRCDSCDRDFSVSRNRALALRRLRNVYCKTCFEAAMQRRTEGKTKTCIDCGNSFLFTFGEEEFYTEKGLDPPIRCKDCRERKRAGRAIPAFNYQQTKGRTSVNYEEEKEENSLWSLIANIWKSL